MYRCGGVWVHECAGAQVYCQLLDVMRKWIYCMRASMQMCTKRGCLHVGYICEYILGERSIAGQIDLSFHLSWDAPPPPLSLYAVILAAQSTKDLWWFWSRIRP